MILGTMPPQGAIAHLRTKNIIECSATAIESLEILSRSLGTPFLGAISSTTRSLLDFMETIKQNKQDCIQLVEQTFQILNAIIVVHVESPTGGELPPTTLKQIGKFTETLYKIHTFVEAQQNKHILKNIFRHGEMGTLLKECRAGLQLTLDFFTLQVAVNLMDNTRAMEQVAQNRLQEVLDMIEALSEASISDSASSLKQGFYGSDDSINSITMLPFKPKIFHGRTSELSHIVQLFKQETPRIAILGPPGMGKTALSKVLLHHSYILARYEQRRCFVACDSVVNKVELIALLGLHLGLKPSKDLLGKVVHHFSTIPPCILILDNLEPSWEPEESRKDVEDFLALLANVAHLALIITLRGAERPSKVQWTRPFLAPLDPLEHTSAQEMFLDIADNGHDTKDVDRVLQLADNMPLAIELLAHLVDSEGCPNILSRWETEKTSLISVGYDRRNNLDLSITLSLSSPRIISNPHARTLLSLLSILPDGLSEAELLQCKLPIDNILSCRAALIRTSLAFIDDKGRLKVLVPIREYVQKSHPPAPNLVAPARQYFQQLLEIYDEQLGNQGTSEIVSRISANYSNIQHILISGLQPEHPDLVDSIYCTCSLNNFSRLTSQNKNVLMDKITTLIPYLSDHRLQGYYIIELLSSWIQQPVSDPETLINEAMEHFKYFDDPDLKCRFYGILSIFHLYRQNDIPAAINYCETLLALSVSSGNIRRQSQAFYTLAWIKSHLGANSEAQVHAYEARRLAIISADLNREALALRTEAKFHASAGNYPQSISLLQRTADLLAMCGLSGGELAQGVKNDQGGIHIAKSEYVEAITIMTDLYQDASLDLHHAISVANIAAIEIKMGASIDLVQERLDKAKAILDNVGQSGLLTGLNCIQADLNRANGDAHGAQTLFLKTLKIAWGRDPSSVSSCLEQLGNIHNWNGCDHESTWTTVFFAYSMKSKQTLEIYKALQFLGDVFLIKGDQDSANKLFTLALEGFTRMDVHCSRAECMVQLGDISQEHGDLKRAISFWRAARPLFSRSSQAKQIEKVDERLARISRAVKMEDTDQLAHLVDVNSLAETLDKMNDKILC